MKILRIRLKNLNSLRGEHSVDLTSEPLASAGLFAITGPTGAGKSTLLDAVTLALYGKAARYGNESNPEHVMSRHTGECSAEVEFEVPSGVYRAVWERHRSRKKADGALQQPKRYIYNQAGEPLAQQIREAELKIEELLGLNYERFLRSALLAQGEFARFLKADANERAELLESLTGTVIYSRLGQLAFEEANRRESELNAKQVGLGQIIILEEAARIEIEAAIIKGDQVRQELAKEMATGAEMLGKIASLEEARRRENMATVELGKIEKDQKAAAVDLERLRRHRLTLPFTGDLARLEAAEQAAGSAARLQVKAVENHSAAKTTLHQSNHTLRLAIAAALETLREDSKKAKETVQSETDAAKAAGLWLKNHEQDAVLADQMGDLVAAIGDLKSARVSLEGEWTDWKTTATEILPKQAKELPKNLDATKESDLEAVLEKFIGLAEKKQGTLETEAKSAKKQFDLRKHHLETAKLVAKLEDHRHVLENGKPCPLCGALEHPYATGAAPSPEIAELEETVTKANEKLEDAVEAKRTLAEKLQDLKADRKNLITSVADCTGNLKALEKLLQPLAEKIPTPGREDTLRTELQEREQSYRKQLKKETDAKKCKTDAERIVKEAVQKNVGLEKQLSKLSPLPATYEADPVDTDDLPPVTEAEEAYAEAVQEERTTATQARDRITDAKTAMEKLGDVKKPLEVLLAGTEFKTLDNLQKGKLATDAAKKIEGVETGLKHRATSSAALLKQARQDVTKLIEAKTLESEAAVAFKTRQSQLKIDNETLLETQTTRRNQINTDKTNQKLRQEKEKELEADRTNLVVWKRLREMIGSHDGSKFRRYAQAISLDILTRHANRHLAKLSDRYRISRDVQEALNLQIEDLHQASVRRPMASLSGGESFLASLALALGLSDLAGRTVRIDSLFIDEGFGSLDPETLEVAIASLESLRQDHKTVGVISHVGLLKERISTQIVVEKMSGGISRIRVVPEAANI